LNEINTGEYRMYRMHWVAASKSNSLSTVLHHSQSKTELSNGVILRGGFNSRSAFLPMMI